MQDTAKFDAKLIEGVAYFERMLELMPEDRTTLEFLVVAYAQLGLVEKGDKALVSLAKLLIKEGDTAALTGLLPRLEASGYEQAKILALKVKTMTAPMPELVPEQPKELTQAEKNAISVNSAVDSEKLLAKMLLDGGVITAEEAKGIEDQLDAVPRDGRIFLTSALQILEKENAGKLEKAMAYLADRCKTPPIPLAAFEVPKDHFRGFDRTLLELRGVVPFGKVGGETLIALANPADESLREEFAAKTKARFFLAYPAEIEAALKKHFEGESLG